MMKSIGGIAIGTSLIGSARAKLGEKVSLEEFEEHCKSLQSNHGEIKDTKTIVRRRDGKIADPRDIKSKIDTTGLYETNIRRNGQGSAAAVELLDFEDGTELVQHVIDGNTNILIILDGKLFKLDRDSVKHKLQRRLRATEPAFDSSHQTSLSTRGVQTTASSYTHGDFAQRDTHELSIPLTSKAKTDANWTGTTDKIEAAASGTIAGYGNAQVMAWDTWTLGSGQHEITVDFNGSWSGASMNAAGMSEIMMQCYIHDDSNNKIQKSNAFFKSAFIADFWADNDSYSIGLHEDSYKGDNIDIGIHLICKAAAASYSMGTADVFSGNSDSWDGFFKLDEYTLEIE